MEVLFETVERCLLEEEKPSVMLRVFASEGKFNVFPFSMLLEQQHTEQSLVHHPEGNVWNHTLLVVDGAAERKMQSTNKRVFMWAALLHDIGKPTTTKVRKGKITAYDHDKVGADLTRRFLFALTEDTEFIECVAWLVRYHMQILYVIKNLPFQDIEGMKAHTNLNDIALLGLCDRLGRTGANHAVEEENIHLFMQKCAYST